MVGCRNPAKIQSGFRNLITGGISSFSAIGLQESQSFIPRK